MPSLWFCVPCHGRQRLARICLTQLRHTCDQLEREGVYATAVVVADDENLDTARDLGFGVVERDNLFTSRKYNDGIQFATDPSVNPRPADYVVPCGSDDWVDWRLFVDLPARGQVYGFQHLSFVREDGREITEARVRYDGGCGIRIYPAALMRAVGYRPADEDRERACDTSILRNLQAAHDRRMTIVHQPSDPRQIVDWKSRGEQLNSFTSVRVWARERGLDPFEHLAGWWPDDALRAMQEHYSVSLVAA